MEGIICKHPTLGEFTIESKGSIEIEESKPVKVTLTYENGKEVKYTKYLTDNEFKELINDLD